MANALTTGIVLADERERLDALADLAHAVQGGPASAALAAIVERLSELLAARDCSILAAAADGHLRVRAARGLSPGAEASIEIPTGSGVGDCLADRRVPLLVPDVGTEPRFVALAARSDPIGSLASLPLLVADELVGVLVVGRPGPTDWEPLRPFLAAISGLAALALANDRAAASLDRRRRLDQLLVSAAATRSGEVADVLQRAADGIAGALDLDLVGVMLADRDQLRSVGASRTPMGERLRAVGLHRLALDDAGPLACAYRGGETYRTGHAELEPDPVGMMARVMGVLSLLAAPIVAAGCCRGLLMLGSAQPDAFDADGETLAAGLGAQVGVQLLDAELRLGMHLADEEREEREARERKIADVLDVLRHDLRSPVTVILGHAQLLRQARRWTSRAERAAETIEQQARHLESLIERLLVRGLASGAPSGRGELLDFVALVREQVEARSGVMPSRELTLAAPAAELWVEADRTALVQVLDNLLNNAVRHAPTGPIEVEVVEDRGVVLHVRDRGPGLPTDDPEILFERGWRHGDAGGRGLGLYISRRIAEAHGGRLVATNRPDGGACFTLTLPVA